MNNTATNNVVTLNPQQSVVTRGVSAWDSIKKTAEQQRQLWKDVGNALLVGRKLHPSNQAFSKWCQEIGFGDIDRRVRADAMWFATSVVQPLDNSLSHPTNIREWHRENVADSHLPSELQEITPTASITLDTREAEKVAKLVNRASSNDEGSETAQRFVETLAKKHKVSVDELKQAAATGAPSVFYQFTPAQLSAVQEFEQGILESVPEMLEDGLTREAIASVFLKISQLVLKGE